MKNKPAFILNVQVQRIFRRESNTQTREIVTVKEGLVLDTLRTDLEALSELSRNTFQLGQGVSAGLLTCSAPAPAPALLLLSAAASAALQQKVKASKCR